MMPVSSPADPPAPLILWLEANKPVYASDERVSVRWWVKNANQIHLTTPDGTVRSAVAHEAPAGLSFPADKTGIVQLVAEGPGGRVSSGPLLIWVLPAMPTSSIIPMIPQVKLFLPLAISESARAASSVSKLPTDRMYAADVLRRSTGLVCSATNVFAHAVVPQQLRRHYWLRRILERIHQGLRELSLPNWQARP